MIAATLLALSTVAMPSALPAAEAAHAKRPMLALKGVVGARSHPDPEAEGKKTADLACFPHPTKNATCRHQVARAAKADSTMFAVKEEAGESLNWAARAMAFATGHCA